MQITIENILDSNIKEIRSQKSSSYFLCGIDVYKSLICAEEEGVKIDTSRSYENSYFFSSRYFELFNLLEPRTMSRSFTTLQDVKIELTEKKINKIDILNKRILYSDEQDIKYFMTPLTKEELHFLEEKI